MVQFINIYKSIFSTSAPKRFCFFNQLKFYMATWSDKKRACNEDSAYALHVTQSADKQQDR